MELPPLGGLTDADCHYVVMPFIKEKFFLITVFGILPG